MILSIRNVNRFVMPLVSLIWFLGAGVCISGAVQPRAVGGLAAGASMILLVLVQVRWLTCPRCALANSSLGAIPAPFGSPTTCRRCGLDFRDRTYWSSDNRQLRSAWLAEQPKPTVV